MHNLKRIFAAAGVLLVLGAFSVFANGQSESTNLTGTVSSIQPTGSGNQVNIVLTTKSGTYTVTVDQSVVSAASLQVGKAISLKGVLHKAADGAKSVEATEVEVDGHKYEIAQHPPESGTDSTASTGKAETPDTNGSTNHQAEKPEVHRGVKGKSKDSERPEVRKSGSSSEKDD